MDLFPWLAAYIRSRFANEKGQGELLVLLLLIFIIWLLVTNRRVTVQ